MGTQENPHQVINQAEAEQMVQNGEIQPGDIVTTADGIQFSAGEPPEPPSVVEARARRGDRQAREADMRAREDAAIAEQAEAQRLDAEEAAKREPSIYSPQEQLRQQQNASSLLQSTGLAPHSEPTPASNVSDYREHGFQTEGSQWERQGVPGVRKTPMEMEPDGPRTTGLSLGEDGQMRPTTAPGREYMAELEARQRENLEGYSQPYEAEPTAEYRTQYGIEQSWEERFGQGPPTTTKTVMNGKVHYEPTDEYKVPVFPDARVADQRTVEGIKQQMQYNTDAWMKRLQDLRYYEDGKPIANIPNREAGYHGTPGVSARDIRRRSARPDEPTQWQGPLQGF
tara:strand:- start:3215 stop:4237 length:1023 start_codon:yes stop_codon:yes gene_type:complete